MTGFRKLVYRFTGFIILTLLLQLPFAFAVSNVLEDKATLPNALEKSGAYEKAVPLILEDIATNNKDPQANTLLQDPKAREAITSAIKPNEVRTTTESVINPLYDWLEGRTDTFDFRLDLTSYRDNILSSLGTYVEQRANKLPTCTPQQLQSVDFNQDILSIPCVPPGVTGAQIKERFIGQTTTKSDFLSDPVITKDDFDNQADTAQNNQTVNLPNIYQNFQNGKWTTLALTLIGLALLIFARHDRIAGTRYVSKLVLTAGVILGFTVLSYYVLFSNLSVPSPAGELALSVLKNITDQLMRYILWFVAGYLIVGAALLVRFKKTTQIENTQPSVTGPITPA